MWRGIKSTPRCMPSLLSHESTHYWSKGFQIRLLTSLSNRKIAKERTISNGSVYHGQEIRAEYVRHFLTDEFVVGREKEARLFKSIIDKITAEDVQQVAEQLRSSASCVVKAVSHRRHALGPSLQFCPDRPIMACLVKVVEKCMASHMWGLNTHCVFKSWGPTVAVKNMCGSKVHGQEPLSAHTEGACFRTTAVLLGSRPAVCALPLQRAPR